PRKLHGAADALAQRDLAQAEEREPAGADVTQRDLLHRARGGDLRRQREGVTRLGTAFVQGGALQVKLFERARAATTGRGIECTAEARDGQPRSSTCCLS